MNFQQAWCHCFYKDIAAMRLRGVIAHVFYKEIAAMRLKTVTLWMLATKTSPLCGSIRNMLYEL